MRGNDGGARELGKGFGLFAAAFGLLVAVLSLLSMIGLPKSVAAVLFVAVALSAFVVIGFFTRTMHLPAFQVASRRVPAGLNGMATAAAFLGSAGFLGLPAAFFEGNRAAIAVVIGWALGFLALAVLVAPYLRKAAAVSVADFLAIRFGSAAVRLAAFLVTVVCLAAFLVAEIAVAGRIVAMLLPVGPETAIVIVVVIILAGTLLGGMEAVTLTAIAQYIVLAIAFLTPVTILSLQQFDFPFPQLSYGYALKEVANLGGPIAVDQANRFLPLPTMDRFNMVVLAVSLAAGVAALPHVAMRSATTTGVVGARRSAGWACFFVLVIVATAPAYGAFAQLVRLESPSDGSFDAALLVLNLPDVADLLPATSALAATGALAAILAAATALLFAIASTAGHDFYGGIIDRKGPSGRRLIVTRVVLIAVASLAGWQATEAADQVFAVAATSASLAASGLFPALVLGVWWNRATALGALAGIVFGFAAAAAYVWMVVYGDMPPWQPLGTAGTGLPPMAAAFLGLPVGLLAIVLVSQIAPNRSPERMEILETIRRPTPSPTFDA
jgi:cation/acetate symporter